MGQFAVHRNPNPATRSAIPYLLDVQSDLLSELATRVVVPLVRERRFGTPAHGLNPVFEVEGARVVMSTAELAGVRRRDIGAAIASLAGSRDEIGAALDFLIVGF